MSLSRTAVVILNWNGAEMMRQFLPSVERFSADADIVVADNGSTDNSLALLADEFPSVKTIAFKENYGFAEGYNQAIKALEAGGNHYEFIVLLNSDVEVTENWLAPLIAFMDSHLDCAACQPKLLAYHAKNRFEYAGAAGGFIDKFGYPFCRGRIFSSVEQDLGQYDTPLEIHWATGACMLVRTEDYLTAGGLDNRFFAHNEEIDLCWRMRVYGRKIYCVTESKVFHVGGGTLPQGNPRKTYLNFRNNLTMLYKNLPEKNLRKVMRARYWLDRLAILQRIAKLNIADAKAIMKAREDYKKWKQDYERDRLDIQAKRQLPNNQDLTNISILWQYFIKRKQKYSDLFV